MEETYKGYNIKIENDSDPMNPREESNYGLMVCFHKEYTLGDKHSLTSEMFDGWEGLETYLIKEYKAIVILPLFVYDHSGLSMRTYRHGQHSSWDCGQVGFIYATKESINSVYGKHKLTKSFKEKIEKWLEQEVNTYSQYISGEVYNYVIESNGNFIDSCGGYYDVDEALAEAKKIVDSYAREEKSLQLQY